MGITLITPEVILSYPKIWQPVRRQDDGPNATPKWSVTALFSNEAIATPAFKVIWDTVIDVAIKELGVKPGTKIDFDSAGFSTILGDKRVLRMPFRKNTLGKYDDDVAMFVNANKSATPGKTIYPPQVLDRAKRPITDESQIYPGVRALVSLSCYAYKNDKGWGVSLGLNNVMKTGDGPQLGSYRGATAEFGAPETSNDFDAAALFN